MLLENSTWLNDIDVVLPVVGELSELNGKTILVTGATGLICSAVVDIMLRFNDTRGGSIKVLAAGRSKEKILACFGDRSDVEYVFYDASGMENELNFEVDYIIHGASNATPERIMKEPVETMMSNFMGMKELLDYAKEHDTKRVLFISSSEVYGKKDNNDPFAENEYGGIDIISPRSSYPESKQAAETLAASYMAEYGTDFVSVRPGHIYGPTAFPSDNRVSSVWPYAVAMGKDLVMKSEGAQIRSYCHCLDCASAILKVLLCGERGTAYNISNPNSIITIKQMAEILTEVGGVELKMDLPTDDEKKSFSTMTNASLNSDRLEALGWKGVFDAKTGFDHTVRILKDIINM